MTIYERALELVPDRSAIGLGSGRAAWAFVEILGERIRAGRLRVQGVPTSEETARIATQHGVPLIGLNEVSELFLTVDGADEVDPNLDLIKGYGRALVREKVVAASSRQLVILVGEEKLVPRLGTRGRLPIEIVPFALPLCLKLLDELALKPILWEQNNQAARSDNGNYILDCTIDPIADAGRLERSILNIAGIVDTGLFLNMAQIVLVGNRTDFNLIEERRRG
jgi:ribose 5-phosphate isomerase A